jgi:HD-GYP domain-containing protein (c-di-GMP phosphodiesterase class II)
MVKFADLQKKGQKKKGEPDSSPVEKVMQQKDSPLDALDWYQRACKFLECCIEQVRNHDNLDVSEGERVVEEIALAYSQGSLPQELLIQALHGESDSSFLVTNAVNVTVYAMLISSTLGLSRERQMQLGLAALLHDIGKVRVPDEILHREESLTEEKTEVFRKYPSDSFEILNALGENYHYLAECGLQLNERLDGSGYPQGLKNDEIDAYAQIIGLLDLYESLTHDQPQRPKLTHFEAVKEIMKTQKKGFHREYLKALLNTFSLFPIHSLVQLNTGAIGRVIRTYMENPVRPKIEIVVDAQKRRVASPRVIDLREQPILHVVEAVEPESLSS